MKYDPTAVSDSWSNENFLFSFKQKYKDICMEN